MCEYCKWCFCGDESDFIETLKEWAAGMKRNHPDWKPHGLYKEWIELLKE